jgi:hypothetical protein
MSADQWIPFFFLLLAMGAQFLFKNKKKEEETTDTVHKETDFSRFLKVEKEKKVSKPSQKAPLKKREIPLPQQREVIESHEHLQKNVPRVREVIERLPNLRNFILCKEILDKPKGLQ